MLTMSKGRLMKNYWVFPPPIRLKPVEEMTYIFRAKGTLTYNCELEKATGIKKTMVLRLFRWPITIAIEKGLTLLDVLFHHKTPEGGCQCGIWFRMPHKISIRYLPLGSHPAASPKTLKKWIIPQRFWSWKVLTRSKKLIWKSTNPTCKAWAY